MNVFGQLDAYRSSAARVLSAVLGRAVNAVLGVVVEHAPPLAKRQLGDRSAFDAYLELVIDGQRTFVGVETKCTEPFSAREYARDTSRSISAHEDGWLLPGAADTAPASATNQLWRTLMLAQATEAAASTSHGSVLVLSLDDDPHALRAVDGMRRLLRDPE